MTSKTAEQIKSQFTTGSVPTETDFNDLIELANGFRSALGLDDAKERAPLPGLTINNDSGQLELNVGDGLEFDGARKKVQVKIKPNSGVSRNEGGLALMYDETGGLTLKSGKLAVNRGNGLKLNGGSLEIIAGDGLTVGLGDSGGVKVNLAEQSGLYVTSNEGLTIMVDKSQGYLDVTSEGLILSDKGVNALKEGGCNAFIDAIQKARENLKSAPAFDPLETRNKKSKSTWAKDILSSFNTIVNAKEGEKDTISKKLQSRIDSDSVLISQRDKELVRRAEEVSIAKQEISDLKSERDTLLSRLTEREERLLKLKVKEDKYHKINLGYMSYVYGQTYYGKDRPGTKGNIEKFIDIVRRETGIPDKGWFEH